MNLEPSHTLPPSPAPAPHPQREQHVDRPGTSREERQKLRNHRHRSPYAKPEYPERHSVNLIDRPSVEEMQAYYERIGFSLRQVAPYTRKRKGSA